MTEKHNPIDLKTILEYPVINNYNAGQDSWRSYVKEGKDRRELVVRSGTINGEYVKTDPQYFGNYDINIRCTLGEGVVLLQKFETDEKGQSNPDRIEVFSVTRIQKDTQITILPNFYSVLVNTGKGDLVVEDDSPKKLSATDPFTWANFDYKMRDKIQRQGFAFRVIKGQNDTPMFMRNVLCEGQTKRVFLGGFPQVPMD